MGRTGEVQCIINSFQTWLSCLGLGQEKTEQCITLSPKINHVKCCDSLLRPPSQGTFQLAGGFQILRETEEIFDSRSEIMPNADPLPSFLTNFTQVLIGREINK